MREVRQPAAMRPAGGAPGAGATPLTVERIAAVEPLRDVRVNPRDRSIAYLADAGGARQLFVLSLRGGAARQVTAAAKPASEPAWSPDGRRLAFVRDDGLWVVETDGSRETLAFGHPAGVSLPRWAPDGRRLAFVSRRRGWGQAWIIDAPVPRRGRPAAHPHPPEPRAVTPVGIDVADLAFAPDGGRLAYVAQRLADLNTCQISVVDLDTGTDEIVAGEDGWATAPHWLPDGGLLYVADSSGWFQVMRRSADGTARDALTTADREHGEPNGSDGYRPLASPDARSFVHAEFEEAFVRLVVGDLPPEPPRGRDRTRRRTRSRGGAAPPGRRIDPWDGVWRAVGWLADGAWIVAVADSETRPADAWLVPVPGRAPSGARPRQVTESLPAVVAASLAAGRPPAAERVRIPARDGLVLPGTLWRPPSATGRRGGTRVPAIVYPHGGPTAQSLRSWAPFKQLLVREGFALLDVDFRGSTGYGRSFRQANHGEWGHADAQDIVDAGRWAAEQPWCDGRLAVYGGSYGGYLVLCALVEEPSLWRAGVDLYGDSEIAESYRHGDRIGRLDLERQMGRPDDPETAALYRRGSPLYRAERIEAPLLILHGRKDKRVVPLMTEKMVEALEIEGKHHEVHWYDDEGHGWERRENRRDAWERILAFLRRHVLERAPG